MNKRQVGTDQERKAAEFLREQGYDILECNFRCRTGEIDIIAREGQYLCFVEVKYRADTSCGSALEAVTRRKQQNILKVSRYYLVRHGLGMDTACRFDVVAVTGKEVTLIRNAFGE